MKVLKSQKHQPVLPQSVGEDAARVDLEKFNASAIRTRLIRVRDLDDDLEKQWRSLREARQEFSSPYFHIEFIRAVDRVRDDIEIALMELDGEAIGFFPFQRTTRAIAQPVGGRLNDYHGIISTESAVDYAELLRQCQLKAWKFHALVSCSKSSTDEICHVNHVDQAPFIDLSGGFENYVQNLRDRHIAIRRHPQKFRKLEREIGPVELEVDCRDETKLDHLIALKRQQFQRTKTFDILSVPWTVDLLKEIWHSCNPELRGQLSVLSAGGKFIAAHFGIANEKLLHYWFPVYDTNYSQYSPGIQLFLDIAKSCAANDIAKIDLGYGYQPYKDRLANGHTTVTEGVFALSRWTRKTLALQYHLHQKIKHSKWKEFVKPPIRSLFPKLGKSSYR